MDARLRLAAEDRNLSQMGHWNFRFADVLLVLGCFTLGLLFKVPFLTFFKVPFLTFFKDPLAFSSHFLSLNITISGSGGSDFSPLHALHLGRITAEFVSSSSKTKLQLALLLTMFPS